ncbi:MAG: type secretion system protein TrbI [Pseudomonadota bacterium]|nr:type secretion system protein TrbI [Pseudomonadota bacterium]
MGNLFAKTVKTYGLSKMKILLVGGILLIGLVIIMLVGIYDKDEQQYINKESKLIYIHSDTTNSTADQVLEKIMRLSNASAPIIHTSAYPASDLASHISESADRSTTEVPPITTNSSAKDEKILRERITQIKDQFKLKQIDNQYTSFNSKTLIFSNTNASSNINKGNINNSSTNNSSTNNGSSDGNNGGNSNNNVYAGDKITDFTKADTKVGVSLSDLGSVSNEHNYSDSSITASISPYELKAGSVIPATMINGINSDLPGQVIAQIRDNIYNSTTRQYLLIPQGAKLVGVYDSHIIYGQERILVAWNRLIYPNGNSVSLKGMPGTDLEGYAGFSDEVDNKYWKLFGASFIMGVITAGMQYSQNNTNANVQSGGLGITTSNPSFGQTLSGSLGQQLGQTGLMVTQKNLNVQPTLIVKPGYPFNVMITADLILKPYV